jgi:hypothetical protein
MKWIVLALCIVGTGCQKTIHEARAVISTPAMHLILNAHC